ncbi:MAG: polysulfide reductase NrfD [Gemmatimonadota bacterium]|nr:MAG: polysulfide reductase NrfD [Gemmatimonadota bacterium]
MIEKKSSNRILYGWMVIVIVGLLIGIWGAVYTLIRGLGPWGVTDQIPWGIVTAAYVFFVAASAGCITVSLGHALGIKGFELIIKRAVFLAIITLFAGGILIVLHLGSPIQAYYLLISPNVGSPLGWMVIFYTLYLVLLVIDFSLLHKNDVKKARVIGIIAPLAAIGVHSTLGAVFGFAVARPFYGGAFAPVYFVLIAIIIGTALVLFVTTLQFSVSKSEMSTEFRRVTATLAKFLALALGVAVLFTFWRDVTGLHSTVDSTAYQHSLSLWWYWAIVILLGLIIPLFLFLNRRTRTPNGILVGSFLVLIGMFAARMDYTIGGLIEPMLEDLKHLEHGSPAQYSASFAEIAVVMLAVSLTALLYMWGTKKLALKEVPHHS